MEGLTAKVFRTYNASHTFQIELKKEMANATTVTEKMVAYNEANRKVVIFPIENFFLENVQKILQKVQYCANVWKKFSIGFM